MADFFIAGQTQSSAGRAARIWNVFEKITGHTPDLTPQPTGNCVAAAADDVLEGTQCVEIAAGEAEEFHPIYNPFHYYTGRELVGKGRLRGRAGSVGSWQSKAIEVYGSIRSDQDGLPSYNRRNVDAWGNGRKAQGISPESFLQQAKPQTIGHTAFVQEWPLMRDALFHGYLCTIASRRGYTMKPRRDGFHAPSGSWNHQMSVWGYSEEGPERDHWVAIKNQWGNVHGKATTPQGDELPPGFILVRLRDFRDHHLAMRGCEAIAFSAYNGFPAKQRNKIKHRFQWTLA